MKNLAMAYSVKRKPKKMAKGGPVSAKEEKRPNPDQTSADSKMVMGNSGDKAAKNDKVLDQPTVSQARAKDSRKAMPIKHPRMVPSSAFSVRLRDEEDDLQESADVNDGPQIQPPKHDNEEGPDRQGPKVAALEMKKMAKGGVAMEMGSGPEEDEMEHPAGLESDDDMEGPAHDEFMAGHFAEGGMLHDEIEDDHHDSIAAAIMARKDREKMAEGGQVNGKDSIYPSKSSQVDLSRNAEEDANMEDQSSYDALRKENYSETAGLDQLHQPEDSNMHGHEFSDEDAHDMISSIRSKIAKKRQFGR